MTLIFLRILAAAVLGGSVLYLPWWVGAGEALIFFFVFENYVEMLLAAFFADLLYSVPLPQFGRFEFILSLSALALFVLLGLLKKQLRVSPFDLMGIWRLPS